MKTLSTATAHPLELEGCVAASRTESHRWRAGLCRMLAGAILAGFGVAACAQTPPTTGPVVADSTAPEQAVVNSTLDAPLFYQLLIGELNAASGDSGAAYSLMLDAARKQNDPQLFQRAVEIALQARSGEAALGATRAWLAQEPGSIDANRYALQILLALNRAPEAGPALRSLLAGSPDERRDDAINAIPQTFARIPDRQQALDVVKNALSIYLQGPHAPAAWTTIGRMELAQGDPEAALASARKGHEIQPTSPFPPMLALELVENGESAAEPIVLDHLRVASPMATHSTQVQLFYARILLDQHRTAEAAQQLTALTSSQPNLAEAWLLLATLQEQENRLTDATKSLEHHMRLVREGAGEGATPNLTQAYLLMARIAEKQGDLPSASAWLDRIENADDIMAAQMRRASLLARQGQMEQARALLRNQPERRPEDARFKLVAEAQLLRDFKQWDAAYEVYAEAVQRFPEQTDLLYDQAMVAERADKLAEMETLLRRLMALSPDFHHAYNALGYSLADRNIRLPEAKTLIEKAVELAPGDAYIQDSLGWVEFRMGNTSRALTLLQGAYGKRPDPEIAAHLGEVLWSVGQRDEALKVWREGLLLANDNETLLKTLKRLQVEP
jgi:tetratricopeptide (TPR) repeat protein